MFYVTRMTQRGCVMKKLSLYLLFLGIFPLSAQSTDGFRSVRFGLDRQAVIEEIFKLGYDVLGQSKNSDRIIIPVFMMGDLPVQVNFLFNKNGKFYSLEFRTGRIETQRMRKLFEAAEYISYQFSLKFGKPNRIFSLDENNVLSGVHNVFREWTSNKNYNIYTAVIENDYRYYTVGIITHQALAKEPFEKELMKPNSEVPAF